MGSIKLGSLFDGSGGFPLAACLCGITPVWASEVEPYPIAVTRSRFPTMKHLGDISRVNGAEIEPVDVITFGSPCQDLSIAGKRAGLKHAANGDEETTRSGLFIEAVRVIREMRCATNGRYPRFALWENVPGAFSSNKGEDFRSVLEELIKIVEPEAVMPDVPQGGWARADCYRGDGWSLAYRTLDAQYWGVTQRRRRIYLVADFTGQSAGKILFEREGLRGYFTQSSAEGQGVAGSSEARIGEAGGNNVPFLMQIRSGCEGGGKGPLIQENKSATLSCANNQTLFEPSQSGPRYAVRRLTPTECARLQGFPDNWGETEAKSGFSDCEYQFWLDVRNTHAAINGKTVKTYTRAQMLAWYSKLHTDSAEYKMWGNGIALPTALYVMQGIENCLGPSQEVEPHE
jgi:DNA (cytosine-5)-methyltransferase 1